MSSKHLLKWNEIKLNCFQCILKCVHIWNLCTYSYLDNSNKFKTSFYSLFDSENQQEELY